MTFFIFGLIGGIIRGFIGIIKHKQSYSNVQIDQKYLITTLAISGAIGFASAWVLKDLGVVFAGSETLPLSLALIVGYAGGDFLENIFKIITKNENIFEVGKVTKKTE